MPSGSSSNGGAETWFADALGVQPLVDRVGARLRDELAEPVVVGPPALRTWAVSRGERSRVVEEEQLRVAAGLKERGTPPALELEPAGDPSLDGIAPPDAPLAVVEATAVAVDEAPLWCRDDLAERGHAVP